MAQRYRKRKRTRQRSTRKSSRSLRSSIRLLDLRAPLPKDFAAQLKQLRTVAKKVVQAQARKPSASALQAARAKPTFHVHERRD